MQIIHILDSFFYTIFPELAGKRKDDLVHALQVHYSYGPYKATGISFFTLVDENKFRGASDTEQIIQKIEEDPYGLDEEDPEKAKEMAAFLKAQEAIGVNTAVVMFMVSAMNQLKALPPGKVKEIAKEIAMQGIHGYSIDGTLYRLAHVPGKKFTGYEILAWYYVSWSMAMPDAVGMLGLNYGKEYEIAKELVMFK